MHNNLLKPFGGGSSQDSGIWLPVESKKIVWEPLKVILKGDCRNHITDTKPFLSLGGSQKEGLVI